MHMLGDKNDTNPSRSGTSPYGPLGMPTTTLTNLHDHALNSTRNKISRAGHVKYVQAYGIFYVLSAPFCSVIST